ncbi:MAG: hydrogenase expression/formation protein HypE [Planctomycetaceae bacterium]
MSVAALSGGDIGSMSVYGTVNDLAVSGAQPLYLTMSLIIEAGFSLSQLHAILQSAAGAAQRCGVEIVAGDTKVVPAGAADGLFINTTGVGRLLEPALVGPSGLSIGDELIVTGPIGRHGIAVLCAREELALTPPPTSDSGSLVEATLLLRTQLGERLRAMRDATRGGVAAVLHEWAESSHQTLTIAAADVPVTAAVRGACELLGLDPLHIANEGTMVVAVAEGCSREALAILQGLPETSAAACIGRVTPRGLAPVTVTRTLGPAQPLDDPFGAPLPRIC